MIVRGAVQTCPGAERGRTYTRLFVKTRPWDQRRSPLSTNPIHYVRHAQCGTPKVRARFLRTLYSDECFNCLQ